MAQPKNVLPVLVTGAAGYVASWVVKTYLEGGFTVHATLRDLANEAKIGHLEELGRKHPGKLKLFEADLLVPHSFGPAMDGCGLVVHTASPFFTTAKNPAKQLIEPALAGTRNVLGQANQTETVRRVVLTSSVVAAYGDAVDVEALPNGVLTEENWNTTSSANHQPYAYSKTLAEQAAWELVAEQGRWDLVVINPGFVFGPSLSTRIDGTSTDMMLSLLNGKMRSGVPDLLFGVVDVREVAQAHFEAGIRPSASGRHLLVAEVLSMLQMADVLRTVYGESHKIPTHNMPKLLAYLVGPFFGLSWKFTARNIGHGFKVDNGRSQSELGIAYRPISETLLDHAAQLMRDGLV